MMQRQPETNKKQAQNHGYLEGKRKVRLGLRSLPKLRGKLEDSASVEGFLSVWGFNGEQRRFVVATGGCGWWRKILEHWKWFWNKEGEEMAFFQSYLDYKAQNAQVSNALGNGNVAHTPDSFSKIPTVRSWESVLWSCRPNFEKIQQLTKVGQHFYRGSFM